MYLVPSRPFCPLIDEIPRRSAATRWQVSIRPLRDVGCGVRCILVVFL